MYTADAEVDQQTPCLTLTDSGGEWVLYS